MAMFFCNASIAAHILRQLLQNITLQTVDGKTVIVVEVSEGRQRPYYIKALGRESGVYVRVAGTTRLADAYMVKELLFEGSNRYYDQALCPGLNITDEDIDALCKAMKEQAVRNAHNEEQKASIKDIGRQQLRSWGVLIERDGKDYPSNAFAILTGSGGLHVATQCGVFKGTTKAVFVDRRKYTGPLWEQIDEAFQFVLRNIHLGATIVGIYRQDVYEIPLDAIRELIVNAMVHRSYLDHGTIQVAVYDNRLEITSPGKLPMGQTMERMKEGYSKIRNEALAHAFAYMNLIEHWGSGIPRIIDKVKAAGLREPEFIGGEVDLRINVYRRQVDANNAIINANGTKNGVNYGVEVLNKEKVQIEKLLQIIEKNPFATQAYYAEQIGVSKRTVSRMFVSLQEKGILIQNGTKRKSNWIIKK